MRFRRIDCKHVRDIGRELVGFPEWRFFGPNEDCEAAGGISAAPLLYSPAYRPMRVVQNIASHRVWRWLS